MKQGEHWAVLHLSTIFYAADCKVTPILRGICRQFFKITLRCIQLINHTFE